MRVIEISSFVLAVLGSSTAAHAADPSAAIRKRLESEYQITSVMADKSDTAKKGTLVELQKGPLLMLDATSAADPCMNTYRDRKLTQGRVCSLLTRRRPPTWIRHSDSAPKARNFVKGEKFWVTKIEVLDTGKKSGIYFDFFTDAIDDIRYSAPLLIPFEDTMPSPDEALKMVAEVITVVPSEDAKDSTAGEPQGAPGGVQQEALATPPPAIEAPPPPAPDPPAVSEGETIDQVVAALGQPLRKAKAGNKDIYSYQDLKVTFVDGKVKDVE